MMSCRKTSQRHRYKTLQYLVCFIVFNILYIYIIHIQELSNLMYFGQKRVTELEQQYSDLEREKTDVQKHLTDCHVLLVAANIDPGEHVFT